MSFGKVVRRVATTALRPLQWEVVKAPKQRHAHFEMGDGLSRAADQIGSINTVIDVGASDGSWSELAFPRFPNAHFLAIEPLVERQSQLAALTERMPFLEVVPAVAGAEVGEVCFHVSDDLNGSGIIRDGESDTARRVPMTTIDTAVSERGMQGPYLIKLDTHGHEVSILSGAKQTLTQTSLVIVEVYNFRLNERALRFHEMCCHMESLGFRCYDLVDPLLRQRDMALWQMDMFFAPCSSDIFEHEGFV